MARPKNKRGFRPITVDDAEYRWRLDTTSGVVEVNLADTHNRRLEVDLGWHDPWLELPERTRPVSAPVTPHHVESAIRFGLSQGWNPESKGEPFKVVLPPGP